jgi:hypothetical protein
MEDFLTNIRDAQKSSPSITNPVVGPAFLWVLRRLQCSKMEAQIRSFTIVRLAALRVILFAHGRQFFDVYNALLCRASTDRK